MTAAKRKTSFFLTFVALLFCAPAGASSAHVLHSKTRAELKKTSAPNRTESLAASPETASRYYDRFTETASDSPVAPKGVDAIGDAAKGFKNFQCKECAESVANALKQKGVAGEFIDVHTLNRQGNRSLHNIFSDGVGGNISTNGFHRAVRVGDTVFDNLNPNGIPYVQWIKQLHGPFGLDISVAPF